MDLFVSPNQPAGWRQAGTRTHLVQVSEVDRESLVEARRRAVLARLGGVLVALQHVAVARVACGRCVCGSLSGLYYRQVAVSFELAIDRDTPQ